MTSPFLALPGAVDSGGEDAGVAAHYGNPLREQRLLRDGAIVDLSNRGVISVSGPDRLGWLDSVTSQALKGLVAGSSTETLLLDPSGHVEHAIRVFDDGVTAWLLVDASETVALVTWLDRMRFTLRVEVVDRTAEFATIGWMPPQEPALSGAGGVGAGIDSASIIEAFAAAPAGINLTWSDPWNAVAAGGHQYAAVEQHPGEDFPWRETLVERADLPALVQRASEQHIEVAGVLAAEALRIAAWRPRLSSEADEKLIPHEVDWIRSAVHLNKGCYRGQETVAKVHNLGHPPRRLVMLHLDGSDAVLPAAGDAVVILDDPENTVGIITSSALHFELGPIALALVKRSTPVDTLLAVASESILVPASQEVIVPPEAGAAVGRIPRLPRLGAQRR
ncbi:CAF17-like 4Fe-4S cluster assembly/insertion protein YgfZ [Subtercola frigoramans]|uniref:Folate-binding protein YgfZ n=1 Tax=Subtercola frigoramans TaxID=120298 RepID=A0ABS2L310_9MICO|nr:folate-binding protein YgfZ [Subtercola frigoramans]MBM7471463.1 folate-binding protein YgfZ [Subtercola frigoramans]